MTEEEKLLNEAAKEAEKTRLEADKAGQIEIPLTEPEADDDAEPVAAEPAGKPGPSRMEKKRQRGENLVQAAKREAEEARREAAELRGRVEELARRQAQPVAPATPQADPLDEEAAAARREYAAYVTRYNAAHAAAAAKQTALSQAEIDKFEEEGWKLKDRMDDIGYRRAAKRHARPDTTPQEMQRQAHVARINSLHGDLTGDQRAANLFKATWGLKLAEGRPDTEETMNLAADETRQKLGMPPKNGRPAPTQSLRSKLSGVPQSGGPAAQDDHGGPLVLTKQLKKMADAALGHIKNKDERYKVFAKSVGRDLRKDGLA